MNYLSNHSDSQPEHSVPDLQSGFFMPITNQSMTLKGGEQKMRRLIALSAVLGLMTAVVAPTFAFELEDASIRVRSHLNSETRVHANTGHNLNLNGVVLYRAEADDTEVAASNITDTGVADALSVRTVRLNTLGAPLNGDSEMEDFSLRSYARVCEYTDVHANTGHNINANVVAGIEAEMDDLTVNMNNETYTGDAIATSDSIVVVNSTWDGAL